MLPNIRHLFEIPFPLVRKSTVPRPRLRTLDYSEGELMAERAPVHVFNPVDSSEARSVRARRPPPTSCPKIPIASILPDDPIDPAERAEPTGRYLIVEMDEEEGELLAYAIPASRLRSTARLVCMFLVWGAIVVGLGAFALRG